MQYIGKLMRDLDPEPIQAALDEINGVSAAANARQHALERLRTRLLEDEAVLGEIAAANIPAPTCSTCASCGATPSRKQAANKPPRAFRELFRVLRELEETSHEPDEPGTADD